MFCPQDLVGIAGRSSQAVYMNGRRAHHVKLHMVQFTEEGMARIGQGVRDLSNRYGVPVFRLKELMRDTLYVVPPNPSLYFLFTVPELGADVHVEIPRKFWRLSHLAEEAGPEEAGVSDEDFGVPEAVGMK